MRKIVYLSLLVCCMQSLPVKAQEPFPARDFININNINALVLVHGDMWWSADQNYAPQCFYPAGAQSNIASASALWMSGYDGSGQLHIAAQTYRQSGNDFWPGPLDNNDTLTYRNSYYWANIWKVNRTDIQYFRSLTTHTISNTPNVILTWPAKGNANAEGNAGYPISVTTDMAPFIDLNGDGIYEPLLGDYPDIKGDQAAWWVFSDNGPSHTQTNGRPLDIEVHAMAYAYSRGTLIDNVVYYDYNIINKSANNYTNFRTALHADIDLGYFLDDYIGFDSSHRMGIQYNGTNNDGSTSGGNSPSFFGVNPPMVGVTMVSLPGDAGGNYMPAGSFIYYNNDTSNIGDPASATDYNNYMRSKLRNGGHFSNDFTGAGMPSMGYGSGPDCNYVFSGDPGISTQWSECSSNNYPGDRRFILTSNDFTLNAGSNVHVVLALVVADSAGGCPDANFSKIKIVADTAWGVYQNPPPPKPTAVTNVSAEGAVKIYPNPAHNNLVIENTADNREEAYITIYNAIGQVVILPISNNEQKTEIDISSLPAGLYNILYRKANTQASMKFMKE